MASLIFETFYSHLILICIIHFVDINEIIIFHQNSVIIMKMRQFNIFICLKSSDIVGNLGRSGSYLISVDAKYCSD